MKAAVNLKKNNIYFHVSGLFIYLFSDLNIYIYIYLKSLSLGFFELKFCGTASSPVVRSCVMENQIDLH